MKRFFVALLLTSVVIGKLFAGEPDKTFKVPVEYYKLDNGLKVVLSEDKTSPIAVVAVYYNIGFRIEPKDRTGFAHLFEHMMFQGSKNLGKMEYIKLVQSNGGTLNGSTRFDFTNYFSIVPSNKLETMLWAEADRMSGLAITEENLKNQQGVVSNEVKVNVLNQPYGGFPWLDMPQYANKNWFNSHNFYGDLADIEAATLKDVQSFFDTYYAPNNAVLAVVGDFNKEEVVAWISKYFGKIKPANVPAMPDLTEPRQEKEIFASKVDSLATQPALAFGYHTPAKNTPEFYAMCILDQILLQGDDARLAKSLVYKNGYCGGVSGGMNALGNNFNFNGPMIWTASLIHSADVTPEAIMKAVDEVIAGVTEKPITKEEIEKALIKTRSEFYDIVSGTYGFGRADLLASLALFDNNPAKINEIETELRKVTPELLQKTAKEYLRPTNRTVLKIETKQAK